MSKQPGSNSRIRQILGSLLLSLIASLALAQPVEQRLSMTMKEADLSDVMDMISREQRVNIFVSSDTNQQVSFSLYDMKLPDAIRAIANAAGMAVEHYEGNYFVVERDEAGKYAPDSLTEVAAFELEYVTVEEMQSLLEPYLSEYGEITVFEERNLFLVEDTPGFLKRTAALVREIDKQPTQILIEAKILEVTLTDDDSYGLDWTKFFSAQDGDGELGVQGLTNPGSSGLFFNFANDNVTAALNALTSQGRVRTLSSPKLLAVEDQESSVIVGDRRGYSVTTTINQVTTESIEFLESGVILRVTPAVDASGQVMMDVHPEVSTGIINPLTGIPSQTTTEVTTRMIVPDGQTIFVGGLIKHSIEESKSGVPVVGRIPGVGRLFSNRENTVTNTETVVLITPTILTADTKTIEDRTLESIDRLEEQQHNDMSALDDEMELFFR